MLGIKTKAEDAIKILISPQMFAGGENLKLSMFFLVISFRLDANNR